MKTTKTSLLILLLCISSISVMYADSPLTSTDFSEAYEDEAIIIKASQTDGELTTELMDYLIRKSNPIDIKMAVINKLGWNYNGKSNAETFMNYLKKKRIYKTEAKFIQKGKGDILLSLAYLKALDNYNDVDEALKYAELALKKNNMSYTYQIITAIIRAQKAFETDWCQVYKSTHQVRTNDKLKADMKSDAVNIIFDYMDLYQGDCK